MAQSILKDDNTALLLCQWPKCPTNAGRMGEIVVDIQDHFPPSEVNILVNNNFVCWLGLAQFDSVHQTQLVHILRA